MRGLFTIGISGRAGGYGIRLSTVQINVESIRRHDRGKFCLLVLRWLGWALLRTVRENGCYEVFLERVSYTEWVRALFVTI